MTGTMTRVALLIILLLVAIPLRACAPDDTGDGVLVVYSSGPRPLAEAIARAYTEHTGVRVELFSATTGQIMAKLEAERYNRRADVVMLASPIAAEHLYQQNRLLNHAIPNPQRHHQPWIHPEGAYNAPNGAAVGIAIREELYRPSLDWPDVLRANGAWRVVMPSPTRAGSTSEFVLAFTIESGESAWDLFHAASRGGLEYASANSQAIAGLLSGSYDCIVGAVDYLILREIDLGAPIRLVYPTSGAVVVTRPVAILRGTAREAAARAFVDFCFDDKAQSLGVKAWLIPSSLDQRAGLDRPLPESTISVDARVGLERLQSTMRRFQYELEAASTR